MASALKLDCYVATYGRQEQSQSGLGPEGLIWRDSSSDHNEEFGVLQIVHIADLCCKQGLCREDGVSLQADITTEGNLNVMQMKHVMHALVCTMSTTNRKGHM